MVTVTANLLTNQLTHSRITLHSILVTLKKFAGQSGSTLSVIIMDSYRDNVTPSAAAAELQL